MSTDEQIRTADYVIVGAGTFAMAFADEMLEAGDADMIIVDRRHRPGGHWNDAYPFVRLHSSAADYGVNSRPLGSDTVDRHGVNEGYYTLPSAAEICVHFDEVMRHRLQPSGRVTYLPMSEYGAGGTVTSLVSGRRMHVRARKKLVDATYMDTKVPATHGPRYAVAEDAWCIAPNGLVGLKRPPDGFVVVGGGKTAMDTCIWLLGQGVDPDAITWIRPREAWVVDRGVVQRRFEFFDEVMGGMAAQAECAALATSLDDLFARLETAGQLMRIDPSIWPDTFRCATLSRKELEQLRRVRNVVRPGHVLAIGADEIVLEHGTIPTSRNHVHIDCSAEGVARQPPRPVFAGERITLQMLRICQPSLSGAITARIETLALADAEKNALSAPVPMPQAASDWARMFLINSRNQHGWTRNPVLRDWLARSRLDGFAAMIGRMSGDDEAKKAILARRKAHLMPALENLERLLSEVEAPAAAAVQ